MLELATEVMGCTAEGLSVPPLHLCQETEAFGASPEESRGKFFIGKSQLETEGMKPGILAKVRREDEVTA